MQSSNTDNFMFPVAESLVYLTEGMTLEPGDILFTGTPSGVGHARKPDPVWMKAGDTIEVEIEGIGVLKNPIEDEKVVILKKPGPEAPAVTCAAAKPAGRIADIDGKDETHGRPAQCRRDLRFAAQGLVQRRAGARAAGAGAAGDEAHAGAVVCRLPDLQ